jgi:hypothetical protein
MFFASVLKPAASNCVATKLCNFLCIVIFLSVQNGISGSSRTGSGFTNDLIAST